MWSGAPSAIPKSGQHSLEESNIHFEVILYVHWTVHIISGEEPIGRNQWETRVLFWYPSLIVFFFPPFWTIFSGPKIFVGFVVNFVYILRKVSLFKTFFLFNCSWKYFFILLSHGAEFHVKSTEGVTWLYRDANLFAHQLYFHVVWMYTQDTKENVVNQAK